MKSMTCRELGGPCDQKLSAATWDEMVKKMTSHVLEKNPDTALCARAVRHVASATPEL